MSYPAHDVSQVVDSLRLNAIEEMAELAISCWRSVAEAAYRGERNLVTLHCRQIATITREGFSVVKSLGLTPGQGDGA